MKPLLTSGFWFPASLFVLLLLVMPRLVRSEAPAVYAIKDARIVTVTGPTIAKGTVLFRNGLITAVGENVTIPPDARVIEGSGLTVYPGLLDAHSDIALTTPQPAQAAQRPGAAAAPQAAAQQQPPPATQPELLAARRLETGGTRVENARSAGITTALVIPRTGIFIGQSALINLAGETPLKMVVKSPVALHIGFTPVGGALGGSFPGSIMGVFAHIRQTLLDAQRYGTVWERYRRNPRGVERPEYNESLEALQPVLKGQMPVIMSVNSEVEIRRAIKLAEEFNLKYILSGALEGYKCAQLLSQKKVPVLVSLNFPERPRDADPEADEPLRVLQLRAEAPKNAAVLHRAGVAFAFHSGFMQNPRDYVRNAAKAVAAGLPRDAAIKALTINAAQILGVSEQLGSIEQGKIANLVVTDGDLFDEKTKIKHVFIDGREIELRAEPERPAAPGAPPAAAAVNVSGTWNLVVETPGGDILVTAVLRQEGGSISGTLTTPFGQSTISSGSVIGNDVHFNLTVEIEGTPVNVIVSGKVEGDRMTGTVTAEGQGSFPFSGTRPRASSRGAGEQESNGTEEHGSNGFLYSPAPSLSGPPAPQLGSAAAQQPSSDVTLIKGGTILTVTKGRIENGSILIRGGKIAAVGKTVEVPPGANVIDATGKYVMPGIIDRHNHIAVDGGVNEGSLSVTSMVRIEDVLDPKDINIYRDLAGGVTTVNVLHGSANAIGGLNAVIKLRWGKTAEEMLFEGAMPSIKFALGENPKRSNFTPPPGTPRRYPATRMGVEYTIREAFTQARNYMQEWEEYNRRKQAGEDVIPPRRDLKLEPLVEVLQGKRIIFAHAYRQDEILMLLRLAEEFGFKVSNFEHALEGYKVAKELAAHGAAASVFSDWWAYKMEAYDSIPYNGALLTRKGVLVSFNSDGAELSRRLNLEAAKAMKYGGLSEDEALALVTINPAKQLRIENRVGSIEVGKDADLVIYKGHPLSTYSMVEKVLIDGQVYFDREADLARRAEIQKEKEALKAKEKGGERRGPPR